MLSSHSVMVGVFAFVLWTLAFGSRAPATACMIASIPCTEYSGFAESDLNETALLRFETWRNENSTATNQRYITFFDVSQHSAKPRFVVIDIEAKKVTSYLAAHGKGSDPDHDGIATIFSDTPGSKATPLGFFKTAETYVGKHGLSLKLNGLEGRNENARSRSIVIHGADYVSEDRDPLGRSWGCPALSRSDVTQVIDQIKEGSFLYIHDGSKP